MTAALPRPLTRRAMLAAGGAVAVGFSLSPAAFAVRPGKNGPKLPGDLGRAPMLDSWIRIGADGKVTVLTGKAELGQGIMTALIQVAAEELRVDPDRIVLVTADTALTPDEGYTSSSHSIEMSGVEIMNAAAQARDILIGLAAQRLGVAPERLTARDGRIFAPDGRSLAYGAVAAGQVLHRPAGPHSRLGDPKRFTVIGRSLPRIDIPAKVTGGISYVQDLRLDGMVHARLVRPPNYAARLVSVDTAPVDKMPGVLKVVHNGNYLAVIARGEYEAILAMRALSAAAKWDAPAVLPQEPDLYAVIKKLPRQDNVILHRQGPAGVPARTLQATYHRPYQIHGSIGPSCAVGLYQDGALTVWTDTQGVYPDRAAIAELLGMAEEKVRCIQMPGAGCYGHNGADDAGADAALLAREMPGRPVRVQWMREQEHLWEPYGPAMITEVRAALDTSGTIVDWHYEVWSNSHSTRPGGAANLMPAWYRENPVPGPVGVNIPQPAGGGDRNAIPLYRLPNARVVKHYIEKMPLRVSALRSLGAYMNVFSIESFVDELAQAAEEDPVKFRLRHLDDQRARDAVTRAAETFGWSPGARPPQGRGRGFAFARYKNLASYVAIAAEVAVEPAAGATRLIRAVAAVDCGQAVNPDGIRNQIEGGIVQSTSWTLYEAVQFSLREITTRDWNSYPILRFGAVPESVEVHIIDRPGQPFLGVGEAAQGPTAAAIANAVADATGVRMRDLPLDRARVRRALGF
ncbi:MAG TPA: molybdopterin cofactor-binding domain-containing protein [Stellaceae bacterium]|nr:molybdopterin cofactor-binding domain-containing protein [Stellaceae bacterium]